jgi:hypothetical protein
MVYGIKNLDLIALKSDTDLLTNNVKYALCVDRDPDFIL